MLGLVVGMGQERLKNALKDRFDTTGWVTLARTRATELVEWLDADYDLVRMLTVQLQRQYEFADVLVPAPGAA